MKNKNKSNNKNAANQSELRKPLDTATDSAVASDIDGSYTGHPLDGGVPVQDADDL